MSGVFSAGTDEATSAAASVGLAQPTTFHPRFETAFSMDSMMAGCSSTTKIFRASVTDFCFLPGPAVEASVADGPLCLRSTSRETRSTTFASVKGFTM